MIWHVIESNFTFAIAFSIINGLHGRIFSSHVMCAFRHYVKYSRVTNNRVVPGTCFVRRWRVKLESIFSYAQTIHIRKWADARAVRAHWNVTDPRNGAETVLKASYWLVETHCFCQLINTVVQSSRSLLQRFALIPPTFFYRCCLLR